MAGRDRLASERTSFAVSCRTLRMESVHNPRYMLDEHIVIYEVNLSVPKE